MKQLNGCLMACQVVFAVKYRYKNDTPTVINLCCCKYKITN